LHQPLKDGLEGEKQHEIFSTLVKDSGRLLSVRGLSLFLFAEPGNRKSAGKRRNRQTAFRPGNAA